MRFIVLIFIFLFSLNGFAQNFNPQLINWFAGADIVASSADSKAEIESDFYVREFEFSANSIIDQTYEGILTLAYHKELSEEEAHIEVHEAYLFSSKLFNMANIKIGKFFLGFGRLNRFHRHDWDFTEAPFVQKSFFGNEGAKDTGFEYKEILPSIGSSLTLGLTSGNEFREADHNHGHEGEGEEESHDSKANAPTSYLKFSKFIEFSTTRGMELGLNYVHRNDNESTVFDYVGFDLIYKNRVGRVLKTLVQFEAWSRTSKESEGGVEGHGITDTGAYLYYQYGFSQNHAFGIRADYYKADDHEEDAEHDHSVDGLEVEDELKGLSLSYIYTNSEFMKTRLTFEHMDGIHVESDPSTDSYSRVLMQFVFSIGAHPAHVY